jgi:hypothetical protein
VEETQMEIGGSSLAGLARLRNFKRRRLSSWDRTGGNTDALRIEAGENAILGESRPARTPSSAS